MARRALIVVIAAVSFVLVACGGSSPPAPSVPSNTGAPGSGSGNGNNATPPSRTSPSPSPSPSGSPCGCTTITEKATKDKLIGGIAVGQDNLIYATTLLGVDIFNPQLNLQPSPSPALARTRFTWPSVPKASIATGPAVSSGTTINALGAAPTAPPAAASFAVSVAVPAPTSQPFLAQYDVFAKTWFNVSLGNFGDKWVSLSAPAPGSVIVVGDHLASNGWIGFLQGFGIACISPAFAFPLGASAIGPDGNLWVATDPSLNSNMPSDLQKNPSILYTVNLSTGTITHTFPLPSHSHVSAIAAGNNAVWFTDDGLNALGEVPMGAKGAQIFPLPNNGTAQAPVSISKDDLGRMWFTEFNGKRVGYITPETQQFTLFKVTGTPVGIVGCVPGQKCPEGNIFFAELTAIGNAAF